MDEFDDRLDVGDADDAWDLDSGDQISDDLRPSRTASARAWVRRNGYAIVGGVAVLVIAGAAAGLWAVAHRPTFVVPSIAVSVDPSTSALAQDPAQVGAEGSVTTELVLHVDAAAEPGVHLTFESVSGTGLTTPDPAPVPVKGATSLTVVPTVACESWVGPHHLLATFRVSDGATARDITVPVEPDRAAPALVDQAVSSACAPYYADHPVRVLGVVAKADEAQALVHLTWTVRNDGATPWTVAGQGTSSDPYALGLRPSVVTVAPVAAHSTVTIESTVEVRGCSVPQPIDPATYSVSLSASSGPDQMDLEVPSDEMAALLAEALDTCDGAPQVTGAHATLRLSGAAASRVATIAVHASVAGDGAWTAVLPTPSWWDESLASAPFPVTTSDVQAPGDVMLTATFHPTACVPDGNDLSLVLTLTGAGHSYPYVVPLTAPPGFTCPAK